MFRVILFGSALFCLSFGHILTAYPYIAPAAVYGAVPPIAPATYGGPTPPIHPYAYASLYHNMYPYGHNLPIPVHTRK